MSIYISNQPTFATPEGEFYNNPPPFPDELTELLRTSRHSYVWVDAVESKTSSSRRSGDPTLGQVGSNRIASGRGKAQSGLLSIQQQLFREFGTNSACTLTRGSPFNILPYKDSVSSTWWHIDRSAEVFKDKIDQALRRRKDLATDLEQSWPTSGKIKLWVKPDQVMDYAQRLVDGDDQATDEMVQQMWWRDVIASNLYNRHGLYLTSDLMDKGVGGEIDHIAFELIRLTDPVGWKKQRRRLRDARFGTEEMPAREPETYSILIAMIFASLTFEQGDLFSPTNVNDFGKTGRYGYFLFRELWTRYEILNQDIRLRALKQKEVEAILKELTTYSVPQRDSNGEWGYNHVSMNSHALGTITQLTLCTFNQKRHQLAEQLQSWFDWMYDETLTTSSHPVISLTTNDPHANRLESPATNFELWEGND